MTRKFILTIVALFFAGQLFADLSLQTIGMADPILVVRNDNSKFENALIKKKYDEYLASMSKDNDYMVKAMMTYEALLPPEAKANKKYVVALTGDFESVGDMFSRAKYMNGKLIGAIEYPVSVKNVFDMIGLLPTISPEVNNAVEIKPVTVEGYEGFYVRDKLGYNISTDILISHDGKTILFGAPSRIRKQITAPEQFPAVVTNAFKATEEQAGAIVFYFPQELMDDIKEKYLDEATLDDAVKSALGGSMALTLAWASDTTISTAYLMAAMTDEDNATLLNSQLLTPWVLPMVQQVLPSIIGAEFSFPANIRAIQNGTHVGLAADLNESDITNLIILLKESLANLNAEENEDADDVVVDFDEEDESKKSDEKSATKAETPAEETKAGEAPAVETKAE